ncbi:MAG: PEP-CTERM sorting domain-containing protein [Phycisphaerae bacterium]|jgi:hypothetical protein|nr:PEP-CTERM sorting domain-containing protein [Phycisphaerae bacterium]
MSNTKESIGSRRVAVLGIVAAVCVALLAPRADALNIVLTFDSGSSDSVTFDNATADNLRAIMNAAASVWEDIIEDSGTLNIEYYYDNLSDANGTLGSHNNLAVSGSGKPTSARIRFDTTIGGVEQDWWFDPSPTNNSEFNIQQTLFRDLSGANQSSWFSGSTPDLLEVGFRGSAVGGGAADGHLDIYSTAIHEIGHAVGLTGNVAGGEVDVDGEYDVPAAMVWGTNTNILEAAPGNYHVASGVSLMCSGCGAASLRRLPTATDVFAAAAASGWSSIDLPRQDFVSVGGSEDWATATNWEGNQVPLSADDAYVRYGGDVDLSGGAHVENLLVDEDSIVFVGSHKLDVDDTATVGLGTEYAAISIIGASGGELEAGTVVVNDGAIITLLNAGLIDAGKVNIETGGKITGSGTIDGATGIKNNGTVTSLGTLILTTAAASGMDLDGTTGNGKVLATLGDVEITGEMKDGFGGDIDIGTTLLGGHTVTFSHDWTLDPGGTLDMTGDNSSPAILGGAGDATLNGDMTVDGLARITSDMTFQSSFDVDIPGVSDKLQLNGATRFEGGEFIGNGTLVQNGDATVVDDTTIDVDVYDWDGGGAATTLVSGSTFTINSSTIDINASDGHDGTVTVFGGTLAVNTTAAWRMEGTLALVIGTLQGQDLRVFGAVNANPFISGTSNSIEPDVTFESGSTLSVGTDSTLTLKGLTTYAGATGSGVGKLVQEGNATVTGDTTIGTATYVWDGAVASTTDVDPGVTLTINSSKITGSVIPSLDGYDGTVSLASGATLAVNTSGSWRLDGTLNMDNAGSIPKVTGSQMNVHGTVAITGGVAHINSDADFKSTAVVTVPTSSELELNGTTTFNGGTYGGGGVLQQDGDATVSSATTIDVGTYDMDGSSGATELTLNESLILNVDHVDIGVDVFNGTLNINNPGELTVNGSGAWEMAGVMNLDQNGMGNKYLLKGDDVEISGTVNVTGFTAILARVDLGGTIDLGSGGDLIQLGGGNANTIDGGEILGPGTVASGGGSLKGHGTIRATVNFFSSADLLAEGGTLTVTGTVSNVGTIGTSASNGVLDMTNAWNTSVAEELQLAGGEVTGGIITNDGTTVGHGTITASGFTNNGTLESAGGVLVIDTIAQPDLDGSGTEDGIINTGSGTVRISTVLSGQKAFNGELNIGAGGVFRMDTYGLSISSSPTPGDMQMTGGLYLAPKFNQSSTLTVSSLISTIDSDSTFNVGSVNTLNADLQIKNRAKIRNGSTFTGSADLVIASGAVVNVESGVTLGVGVVNNGTLNLGASPGIVEIDGDFAQGTKGTWLVELAGSDNSNPSAPQYDALVVSGTADLSGRIVIDLIGSYHPSPGDGDTLDILTASNIIDSGLFIKDDSELFNFSIEEGGTVLRLTVVPEPATMFLLCCGAAGILRRRRKKGIR